MRKTFLLFITLCLFTNVTLGRSKELSARNVFDAYVNTMQESLLHRGESSFKTEYKNIESKPAGYSFRESIAVCTTIFLRDGDRIDSRREQSKIRNDGSKLTTARVQCVLDNGRSYEAIEFYGTAPQAVYTRKDGLRDALSNLGIAGLSLEGYMYEGGAPKPLWDVLKDTMDLRLREAMELIDGYQTYVLEARTDRYGDYTLWIDPQCGFNLRRFVAHRTGNDILNGEPLNRPPRPVTLGKTPAYPPFPIVEHTITLDSVRIENINGLYVPVEGAVTFVRKYSNGEEVIRKETTRRFDIDLNPDFASIEDAFVLRVADGTRVIDRDIPRGHGFYVWRNGRMVPDVDDLVIESLDETAKQLLADGTVSSKVEPIEETTISDDEPNAVMDDQTASTESTSKLLSESRSYSVLMLIVIGLLIVVIVGWQKLGRLKKKVK